MLSPKAKYALQALIRLAKENDQTPVLISDLAQTESIPKKFYVGRFFLLPFKNTAATALQGLGLGVAGSTGTQQGGAASPSLPSYRTPAQQTYFSYRSDLQNIGKRKPARSSPSNNRTAARASKPAR